METTVTPNLVNVTLPSVLRFRAGNRARVQVGGGTVREVIEALDALAPGMRFHVCYETGELRPYVNIFLGPENIRYLQGLDTPVPAGSTLHILHSVAGG